MRALVAGVLASTVLAPFAQADEPLAQRNGCTACHSVDARVVGPAFHDVAVRHRARADAVDYLASKIREGGIGTWGQIPMPAQPGVSEADARALAQWILGR